MFPEYFYNLKTVHFVSGYEYAFMDKNQYELKVKPVVTGEDVLVSLSDLEKIFAPYMSIKINKNSAVIEMDGKKVGIESGSKKLSVNGAEYEMTQIADTLEKEICVPVAQVMGIAFKMKVESTKNPNSMPNPYNWTRPNSIVAISKDKDFKFDGAFFNYINVAMRGKADGELYKTYWFEAANKVMPYSLYIPTDYEPSKPSKMVVAIHGGGLAEQYIYTLSKNMMQFYCEKYNYIFLGPNACVKGSSYGCLIPPKQMNEPKTDDPKNPMGYTKEEIALKQLGDKSVMHAIGLVKQNYNIDEKHIYLMGNSMGALGTFHLPTVHKGMFKAIAPSGGCPDCDYFDLKALKGLPIRLVAGTEDHHGYDLIKYGYKKMVEAGLDVEFCKVGGGVHYDSWAYVLEGTFEFFEKHA